MANRLTGSNQFVPYVWICQEKLVSLNSEIEEISQILNEKYAGEFLKLLSTTVNEDKENNTYVCRVNFCATYPVTDQAKNIILDNGKIKEWCDINMKSLCTEIAEDFEQGKKYYPQHPDRLVQLRLDAFYEFLQQYGEIDPEERKNIYPKFPIEQAKQNLQQLAVNKNNKHATALVHHFYKMHPSNTVSEAREMLQYVQDLGISTIGTNPLIEIVEQTEKQESKCVWCGEEMILSFQSLAPNKATREHMVPKSKGGRNQIENYLVACSDCNSRRGNTEVSDWIEECLSQGRNVQLQFVLEFFHRTV